jgi:hypothetical protein
MRKLSAVAVVLILLAACSSGLPHRGGVLGSHSTATPTYVDGTVNFVDTTAQRIELALSSINNMSSSTSTASVYYDNSTVVSYRGRDFRPADLERGDQVTVHGSNINGRYVADSIVVNANVRQ